MAGIFHFRNVKVGDRVFGLEFMRYGAVTHAVKKEVRVDFGTERVSELRRFDQYGYDKDSGNKTGFWHNPFVLVPDKDKDLWMKRQAAVKAAFALLEG